jgi:hypothetical protein
MDSSDECQQVVDVRLATIKNLATFLVDEYELDLAA